MAEGAFLGNANDLSSSLYTDTLNQYKAAAVKHSTQSQSINQQYKDLYANQFGAGGAQQELMARQFEAQRGQASLAASSRGMGNSTIALNMTRGINADQHLANLQMFDQTRGQLNQIDMNRLGYLGQMQGQRLGLATQQAGFMGQAQQTAQGLNSDVYRAQAIQMPMQAAELASRQAMQSQSLAYGQAGQINQANSQMRLQQQAFANQKNYASEFGYSQGGPVPGFGSGDTVPARLTPGEFVLSKEMIEELKSGRLTREQLVGMLREGGQANQTNQPNPYAVQAYQHGGMVHGQAQAGAGINLGYYSQVVPQGRQVADSSAMSFIPPSAYRPAGWGPVRVFGY